MKLFDMIELGLENLWKAKLRTILTSLGIVIAIGTLTSMVSFGAGMQKRTIETFANLDLLTSFFITPIGSDDSQLQLSSEDIADSLRVAAAPLTDSTLSQN